MTDSTFERHIPCPLCGSSDAGALYSNGSMYCHKCQKPFDMDGEIPLSNTSKPMQSIQLKGDAQRLSKRKLSEDLCKQFKCHRDGELLRFYYYTSGGDLAGCKVKNKDKEFWVEGKLPGTFYGQQLFPSKGKRIVITEGELDAISVASAMPGWPAVSLAAGATSAAKAVKENYEYLQGYETVCLFFDDDAPGRQAAKDAAACLPPGKVTIAKASGYKDASDALQADDAAAIRKAVWDAHDYRPDGIVSGKDLFEVVTQPRPKAKWQYPFSQLNEVLGGVRPGELITLTSGTGQGKSSMFRYLMTYYCQQGIKTAGLFLEESTWRTGLGLMSVGIKKSLHLTEPTTQELQEAYDQTLGKWDVHLYDGFGSFEPDVLFNRIEYLSQGLGAEIIFLDHLSILLSGLDGDERKMIDTTMTRLRSLVERTKITLFLACHLRRPQGDKGHEDGAQISIGQLRGSHGISQLSDGIIGLEKDQQSTDKHTVTTLRVLKNRYSGITGTAGSLSYDVNTSQYHEVNQSTPSEVFEDF